MVAKASVSLQLCKLLLGGHDIRYLSLTNNGYVYSTDVLKMADMKDMPLFLATDILCGIEQDKKNFYRIHSRYAKDGLATKLTFKDVVLVGINNSSGIWFYSVQGLFQAVFEYHDLKTQRHCILELLNLWLARYDDDKLVAANSIKIRKQDELVDHRAIQTAIQSEVSITGTGVQSSNDNVSNINSLQSSSNEGLSIINTLTDPLSSSNDSMSNINTQIDLQSSNDSMSNINTQIDLQSSSNECVSNINVQSIGDRLPDTYAESDLQSLAYDCKSNTVDLEMDQKSTCCAKAKPVHDKSKSNMIALSDHASLQDILNCFVNTLKAECDKHVPTNCFNPTQIETVFSVLELLKEELDEPPREGFPFNLISRYRTEIQKHWCHSNDDEFGILWKRGQAMCVISDWLGQEFNKLEPEIALKVEKFKTDHIECIDSLPQAESMVDMLFPSCMKCLLCSWIGIDQAKAETSLVDHDYGNLSKRSKRSYQASRNLFPLIQIILEFINNALISGVAHVVFTRLLQTT